MTHTHYNEQLLLLSTAEHELRLAKVRQAMAHANIDALLVNDNANLFYLTGRVFCGYTYITPGECTIFLRRPSVLHGDNIVLIRKPEEIAEHISDKPKVIGLMVDDTPYSTIKRLSAVFAGSEIGNGSAVLRQARAVKTPHEIDLLRECGIKQTEVYRTIPRLYREGMTDLELQVEIERALRLAGCLGQFRISGSEMEIFMGNVLTGDNADAPSPYDFAMGGQGIHPSLPVGADGSMIKPHKPVMIDMNGNFNGYMTDMTRTFIVGDPDEKTRLANELSRRICSEIAAAAIPGTPCKDLYEIALTLVKDAKMEAYFMGHRYHAGFVGHGIGITINEGPVIAPRSRDIIQEGNVIALEPKFVIPGVGAVGVENSYVVQAQGPALQITNAPEEIINLI